MRDQDFEWDDGKAASNLRKHGVSFDMARAAFEDPLALDLDDPDPHEERSIRLCRIGERVLVVIWTERHDRVRIISARRASRHEQRTYDDQ